MDLSKLIQFKWTDQIEQQYQKKRIWTAPCVRIWSSPNYFMCFSRMELFSSSILVCPTHICKCIAM